MDATAGLHFPKFVTLPSELQSHIISYNDYKTLANYALCSKVCSADIQQFNTRAPCHIIFHHGETSAVVDLSYKRANKVNSRYSLRFIKNDHTFYPSSLNSVIQVTDEKPCEAAIKFLKDRFKYVKTGECELLEFHGKYYLPELSTISKIQKFNWVVVLYKSMYPKFYDSVKNVKNERMCLEFYSRSSKPYSIPVEFFRTEFFQNLVEFECRFALPELQDTEFLTMKAHKITMNCPTISDKAVNQKIQQWASNPANQPVDYSFFRSNKQFDKNAIMENLNITYTHRYYMKIQHPTGSVKCLFYLFNEIVFRTFSFL